MGNRFISFAALSGFVAIAFGAFVTHGLQDELLEQQLVWIELGWRYQVLHTVALLALGFFVSATRQNAPVCRMKVANLIGLFWVLGIFGFSGGLYALALQLTQNHFIIPIGGTCFLVGWAILFIVSVANSLKSK